MLTKMAWDHKAVCYEMRKRKVIVCCHLLSAGPFQHLYETLPFFHGHGNWHRDWPDNLPKFTQLLKLHSQDVSPAVSLSQLLRSHHIWDFLQTDDSRWSPRSLPAVEFWWSLFRIWVQISLPDTWKHSKHKERILSYSTQNKMRLTWEHLLLK